jgi:hypothetical protein
MKENDDHDRMKFWLATESPSTIKCVDFNHKLGLVITHDTIKNVKGYEYQQQ